MKIIFTIVILSFFGQLIGVKKAFSQTSFDAQVKKMSDTLANKILRTGKKRVAIRNFTDLKGNETELGKFIAEIFILEFSNSTLEVVDKSELSKLDKELQMAEVKLSDRKNALKLYVLTGAEFIITGVVTPRDNALDITINVLDIPNGMFFALERKSFPRTKAIAQLLRSVDNGVRQVGVEGKLPLDELFEVHVNDLRTSNCYNKEQNAYFGQICFENKTGEELVFSCEAWGFPKAIPISKEITTLPNNTRNCSPRITVNYPDEKASAVEIKFTFQIGSKTPVRTATMMIIVERCKGKSIVLTKNNLVFR